MSEPISLTSAVIDARRLQRVAYIPNILGFVFSLAILACIFWGGPLLWVVALAVGCVLLGQMVQHRSVMGAVLLAMAQTAFATNRIGRYSYGQGIQWGWDSRIKSGRSGASRILLAGSAGAFRLRTRFQHSRPVATKHRKLRFPRDRRLRQAVFPAFASAIYLFLGAIAMCFGFLFGHGFGAGLALRPFSKRANREYRKILQVLSYRAQEVRAQDMRSPVLFLRSFMDEDMALQRRPGSIIRTCS